MNGKLTVKLKESHRNYEILIGENILNEYVVGNNAFYIIDAEVYQLYRNVLPCEHVYIFYANEKNKSWESVRRIINFLIEEKCNRKSKVFAIGGGITGDVTAFSASIYMRGIPLIQVPTTLLSMVDSSVGGKTGINFNNVKNLIGTFYQPQQVIIDINFLKTLKEIEFINGLAETIKMAFMFDKNLIEKLIDNREDILRRENNCLFDIIKKSVELKSYVVEIDEKENHERKLLNFGHTIGHAIEVDTDFSIKHGFAVALGMFYECLYGVKHGLIHQEVLMRLVDVLKCYKLFDKYNIKNIDKFRFALTKDKKVEKEGIVLALPIGSGESRIFNNISLDGIVEVFCDN